LWLTRNWLAKPLGCMGSGLVSTKTAPPSTPPSTHKSRHSSRIHTAATRAASTATTSTISPNRNTPPISHSRTCRSWRTSLPTSVRANNSNRPSPSLRRFYHTKSGCMKAVPSAARVQKPTANARTAINRLRRPFQNTCST
jgi:hypothetical protein